MGHYKRHLRGDASVEPIRRYLKGTFHLSVRLTLRDKIALTRYAEERGFSLNVAARELFREALGERRMLKIVPAWEEVTTTQRRRIHEENA